MVVRNGFKLTGSSRLACTMYNQKMFIFWFMWVPAQRWPSAESAAGAGRRPAIPVCGSGLRCADRTTSVPISHTPRTVQGEVPRWSPFRTRATEDDGKSAITTSRLPCREDRARPVSRWAHELPLAHPVHDRWKPSRLATGRSVEAMAAPAYVEARRLFFLFRRPMTERVGPSPFR